MRLAHEVREDSCLLGTERVWNSAPLLTTAESASAVRHFPRTHPAPKADSIVMTGSFCSRAAYQLVMVGDVCRFGVFVQDCVGIGVKASAVRHGFKDSRFILVDVEHHANSKGSAILLNELPHRQSVEVIGAGFVQHQHRQGVDVEPGNGFGESGRKKVGLLFHGYFLQC